MAEEKNINQNNMEGKQWIDVTKFAPNGEATLLIAAPFSVDEVFIPNLQEWLNEIQEEENEQGVKNKIYLDFIKFNNDLPWDAELMEKVITLLVDMNLIDRVELVSLPDVFYSYLRKRFPHIELCLCEEATMK